MGWQDRDYSRESEGGGWRQAFRRIFVEGDNFLNWALPLYTLAGIRVRIHLIFIVVIVVQMITSVVSRYSLGPAHTGIMLGGLFLLVLLHEYGHCAACRRIGGEADEILMWPLGGLAYCRPPHHWKAELITVAGGPAVNLLIVPVTVAALWLTGAPARVILFNPFDPGVAASSTWFDSPGSTALWVAKVALFWLHTTNLILLGFNVLLPMYPLDGGRMVQSLLWRKMGYERSVTIAANIGLVAALVVGIAALVSQQTMLLGVAIFAGFICWYERRKILFLEAESSIPGYDFNRGYQGMLGAEADEGEPSRAEAKRREREVREQKTVDEILAKISEHGMRSLTRREKRTLERASQRQRNA